MSRLELNAFCFSFLLTDNVHQLSLGQTEFDLTHCVRPNSVLNLDLDTSLVSEFRL